MLSKNQRRKIIWQYWDNPFSGDDESEFIDEDQMKTANVWEDNENPDNHGKSFPVRPVIPTPVGFIPIQPFHSFNKSFEFWVGHTNFNISKKIKQAIDTTPGVEILEIISRYCFRFSVGKAFISREVKHDIMQSLGALPPKDGEINPDDIKLDTDTAEKVSILQNTIKDKFPYWAIYIMPNGEIDVVGTNTQDGFDMHLNLYKLAQDIAGGVIYQHS